MTYIDILEETYIALSANKVRSGLTILGIVIGISSVIAMVSIGTGATSSISSRIESLGSNLIQITPGMQRSQGFQVSAGRGSAKTLPQTDADAIAKEISGIKAIAPSISGRYQVTAKGTNTNTTIQGVTGSYSEVRSIEIDQGVFITDTQNESSAKVAVLGPTTLIDLFGDDAVSADTVGQTIRIKGMEFKIVGITKSKGSSGSGDDVIYIPLKSAERFLTGNQYLSSISIQAESAGVMTQVQDDITTLLLDRHKITDSTKADFSVLNQNDLLSTASSITQTLTYLLAAIGGISLVVGGIGIMNMMLTTVTERTKEIGLRKAIGAKKSDINMQFLAEALMLTLIGGIIGVALGWIFAWAMTKFGGVTTVVSMSSVLLAVSVSAVIGIVFGYYPARRASQLNPIEALRYE